MRNKKHKAKLDKVYKIKKQKLNGENTITELQNKIETETLVAGKKQDSISLTNAASFIQTLTEKRKLLKSLKSILWQYCGTSQYF